jgi:hypothetical protein
MKGISFNKIMNGFLIAGCLFIFSCSKSSTNPAGPGSTDTTTTTVTDTIPSNIVDITSGNSNSGLTLTPYPGIPSIPNLILALGLGYYYINIGSGDTVTFTLTADSSGGGNAGISGQTSDSGPNYFLSGDSLQCLVTAVQYTGTFGGTGTAYYTNELPLGYSLTSTDTLNFSDSYTGASIYSSSIASNSTDNLFDNEGFIAFRLKNGSGSRYGWMRLSSDPADGNLLTVYEIAFNKNYNVPIAIGKYK